MLTRTHLIRLLLLALLLALLVLPVVGPAPAGGVAAADFDLFETVRVELQGVQVADCNGGSGGSCGG